MAGLGHRRASIHVSAVRTCPLLTRRVSMVSALLPQIQYRIGAFGPFREVESAPSVLETFRANGGVVLRRYLVCDAFLTSQVTYEEWRDGWIQVGLDFPITPALGRAVIREFAEELLHAGARLRGGWTLSLSTEGRIVVQRSLAAAAGGEERLLVGVTEHMIDGVHLSREVRATLGSRGLDTAVHRDPGFLYQLGALLPKSPGEAAGFVSALAASGRTAASPGDVTAARPPGANAEDLVTGGFGPSAGLAAAGRRMADIGEIAAAGRRMADVGEIAAAGRRMADLGDIAAAGRRMADLGDIAAAGRRMADIEALTTGGSGPVAGITAAGRRMADLGDIAAAGRRMADLGDIAAAGRRMADVGEIAAAGRRMADVGEIAAAGRRMADVGEIAAAGRRMADVGEIAAAGRRMADVGEIAAAGRRMADVGALEAASPPNAEVKAQPEGPASGQGGPQGG
ncbi:hypothetical protein [Sorangium sp. So ce131]|uniref:hypothetical protein n=1 Tax=Sorangium sp. So ce131 TaxID=3133282 RepID=UPI003F5EE3AC